MSSMFALKTTSSALVVLILVLTLGCLQNPARIGFGEISLSNSTSERLFVITDVGGGDLKPGGTQTVRFIKWRSEVYSGQHYDDDTSVLIHFYDELGCAAVTIVATVRQLREDYDHRFVIESEHLTPLADRLDFNLTRLPGGASLPRPAVDDVR